MKRSPAQIALDDFLKNVRNNPEPMSEEAIQMAAQHLSQKGKESALVVLGVLEAMIEFTNPAYSGKISAAAQHLLECDRGTIERTRDTFKRLSHAISDLL